MTAPPTTSAPTGRVLAVDIGRKRTGLAISDPTRTLATPLGVTRRRHFEIAGTAPDERVAAFHDDVLDRDTDSRSASDPIPTSQRRR